MKDKKYKYQLVVVLPPKLDKKDDVLTKISGWLEKEGIEIEKKSNFGIKDLVYEIEKNNKGDFWIMDLLSEKTLKMSELNVFLNREKNVIRYLILKV